MPSLVPSDVPSSAPSSKMASAPLAMPGSDPTTLESGIGLGARKGVLVAAVVVLLGGACSISSQPQPRREDGLLCC
jgi:hypothetical protein